MFRISYTGGVKKLALLLSVSLLLCVLAGSAHAVSTSALVQEVSRSQRDGQRVVNFWWLPLEYWLAAAKERKQPAQELDTIRKLFRNYLILAVIDAELQGDRKLDPATLAEIGPNIDVRRNGAKVEVLHEVDPRVARRVAELSYSLKVSLGLLGPALRIFFLPNIDDQGRPVLHGAASGDLELTYAMGEDAEPLKFFWYAPLTSVAGPTPCPEGGEPLEAHWTYCPWHGVKVR